MGKINDLKFLIKYQDGFIELKEKGDVISFGLSVTNQSKNTIIRISNINPIKNGYIFDKYPWHEVHEPIYLKIYINDELFKTEELEGRNVFYTCSSNEVDGSIMEFVEFIQI